MNEIYWLYAYVWFVLLGVGYGTDQKPMKLIGTVFGCIVGLVLMTESILLALALIFASAGLFMYEASQR